MVIRVLLDTSSPYEVTTGRVELHIYYLSKISIIDNNVANKSEKHGERERKEIVFNKERDTTKNRHIRYGKETKTFI